MARVNDFKDYATWVKCEAFAAFDDGHLFYTTNYKHNVNINLAVSGEAWNNLNFEKFRTKSWLRVFAKPDVKKGIFGETKFSEERRKHFQYAVAAFCQIDNEYELGLTSYEIDNPAFNYAEQKAASLTKWIDQLTTWQGVFSVVLIVITIIVSIYYPPAAAALSEVWALGFGASAAALGASAAVVVSIAGAIANFAVQMYNAAAQQSMAENSLSAGRYSASAAGLEAQRKASEQSNVLTALICYGGYAIYANGSIYKMNAPGSETFSNSLAFDTTKGMRGDIKENEFDEKAQGRVGGNAAGGENYMQKTIGADFPLAKFSYSNEQKLDMLGDKLLKTNKKVSEGFMKLFQNYFNADGLGANTYKRVYNAKVEPIKQQMKNEDFLDKLKNYNRNLRFNFFWIDENTFKARTKTMEIWNYYNSEVYKRYMDSDKYTTEEKARRYILSMCLMFDIIENFADDGVFGDLKLSYKVAHEEGDGYDVLYEKFSLDSKKSDEKITGREQKQASFMGETYFTFGYDTRAILYKDKDKTMPYQISDFSNLLSDYFKNEIYDDSDTNLNEKENQQKENRLKPSEIKAMYDECMQRFMSVETTLPPSWDKNGQLVTHETQIKFFWLIRESLNAFSEITTENNNTSIISLKNEFWAVEIVEAAYKIISVPLYVPENLKEEFENFDWDSLNIYSNLG